MNRTRHPCYQFARTTQNYRPRNELLDHADWNLVSFGILSVSYMLMFFEVPREVVNLS